MATILPDSATIPPPRKVVLFGASALGRRAAATLGDECEIVAFVDNDRRKWGRVWAGRPVHPPEFLQSLRNTRIVVTSSFHAEIGQQLAALGFTDVEVFDERAPSLVARQPAARTAGFIDRIHSLRSSFGETLSLIHNLGHRPATVVDVGVAFGTPELYRAFPEAELLLIEPVAEFEAAMTQIAAQRSGTRYLIAAAGETDGEIEVSVTPDRTGSTLSPRNAAERRRVPIARVDTLCQRWQLRAPYVVKVDVQGHELRVVEGCTGILAETLAVVLEVSFIGNAVAGVPELEEVVRVMKQRGFVAYDILGGHNRPLDLARMQADIVFVREDGPLRADRRWSTPEQAAEFLAAKRARTEFQKVMATG